MSDETKGPLSESEEIGRLMDQLAERDEQIRRLEVYEQRANAKQRIGTHSDACWRWHIECAEERIKEMSDTAKAMEIHCKQQDERIKSLTERAERDAEFVVRTCVGSRRHERPAAFLRDELLSHFDNNMGITQRICKPAAGEPGKE